VILKIHGAVSRDDPGADSYVITENDYIAYLARGDIANELPPLLRQRLASSSFLFLGYGLGDWNLRVILSRLWGERELTAKSWAIQRYEPGKEKLYEIERKLWDDRGEIEQHYVSLADYARSLDALLAQSASAGAV
jgi:hypothetical protein